MKARGKAAVTGVACLAALLGRWPSLHMIEGAQPPVLVAFALADSGRRIAPRDPIVLVHRVTGTTPTHYRVATRADFAGVAWLPYTPDAHWHGTRATGIACGDGRAGHLLRLFFQVRAVLGREVRVIDGQRTLVPVTVESNVLAASACLEG